MPDTLFRKRNKTAFSVLNNYDLLFCGIQDPAAKQLFILNFYPIKNMHILFKYSCILLLVFYFYTPSAMAEGKTLFPRGITIEENAAAETVLNAFLSIPYRVDGCTDDKGRYTLFEHPEKIFETPGLNCSGLVLAASRILLKKNFTIQESKRDRLEDSGPDAPMGHDWDFGWDLIMNIVDGTTATVILPNGATARPEDCTGVSPLGFEVQDPKTWVELQNRIRPGYLYLVSMNSTGRRKGYGLQHYHVGLMIRGTGGGLFFYQTTPQAKKTDRRNLSLKKDLSSFLKAFKDVGRTKKRILIVETPVKWGK